MNSKNYKSLCILSLLSIPVLASALPFTISPKAATSLPTQIIADQPVNAYYTIKNNTNRLRTGNYLKYLPKNVSQVTQNNDISDLCGSTFTLQASQSSGDSCTLQLLVSGAVNGASQNPSDHLFACFPGGTTCAGTASPLNVSLVPAASTVVAAGYYLDPVNTQLIGVTTSTDKGTSWTTDALLPPTGYVGGAIYGTSSSVNFSVGVGGYEGTNAQSYSTIIRKGAPSDTWQQQVLPYLPGYTYSILGGVSCMGQECIAVGFSGNLTTQRIEALIAHSINGGLTWAQQILAEIDGYVFTGGQGVSCTGSTCVAVGAITDEVRTQSWVASTRNGGATWSQQALPYLTNIDYQQLQGVSCTSAACIAVGDYSDSEGVSHPGVAISRNNGSTWSQTILDIVSPFQQSYYSGISCTSSYCVAVGFAGNSTGSNHNGYSAVAITTDQGITWRQQTLAMPTGFTYSELTSVNCSANTCVAAGSYQNISGTSPFTAVSENSGHTWTQTPSTLPTGYTEGAWNAIG